MRIRALSLAAGLGVLNVMTASALPPTHGGAGNAGVNPAVNRQEALQQCLTTCQAHSKTPAACNSQCQSAFKPIYGSPTPIDTSTYNVASCDVSNGAVWAWYTACAVDIAILSDNVTASLATLVGDNAAKLLMGSAGAYSDPCGYVRDQVLAQNAQRCPASILLPKQSVPTAPK